MARGKPAPEQLDLSMDLLDVLPAALSGDDATPQAAAKASEPQAVYSKPDVRVLHAGEPDDYRNYGGLAGIPAARALMAAIMDVPPKQVLVLGNSSLQIMYDTVARSMTHGVLGGQPWSTLLAQGQQPAFVAPVPGYDRHFAICEHFGLRLIPVPMLSDGPNMDAVEPLVASDANIKGIWCVPKYANPTGAVYSDEVVRRLATMPVAASDFRIYWDNAYAVHGFADKDVPLASLPAACEQAGSPDRWYQFASTSKITFAGAGIAAFASSPANLKSVQQQLALQTIGPDKLNQLRHALFLRDRAGVEAHMRRHAAIIAPKFARVLQTLQADLDGLEIAQWTSPTGGYFISYTGLPGTAKRTVALAKAAGVTLTAAGATYPHGHDPADANIRIAPTYPSLPELEQASQIFTVCARIAAVERLLAKHSQVEQDDRD
jgi:aspartate/methionine/tyrosine aminotransferase